MSATNLATRSTPGLFEVPGCEFTSVGLKLDPKLKYEHWEAIGKLLQKAESGIQWWIGDWMAYGDRKFGDSKYAQAVDVHDETGINVDTLRYYQHVSEKVPIVRRLTNLSWSHHQVVAPLPAEEQTHWLETAAAEGLSYRELKREVEKAERKKNFRLVSSVLEKIWERIEDGCYTAEAISKCSECGNSVFGIELEEIKLYMQQLVGSGRAEWRKQGGKTDVGRGEATTLCVPKGMPAGSDLDLGGIQVERGEDDSEEHY